MSTIDKNEKKVGLGSSTSEYWQDVENKVLDKKFLSQEFSDDEFDSFSVKKNRRSFLKIMGFSVSALPLTGCIKIPVKKALPYLNKQDHTYPGVPNWYASTLEGVPVLVKTREGRPIKVEGNEKSESFAGGAGARQQASILSLYDSSRLREPTIGGKEESWETFDKKLANELAALSGDVVFVTPTLKSPTEVRLLKEIVGKFDGKHIAYDSVSSSAEADVNEKVFGTRNYAEYDFEKANVVVSIGSDFLGNRRDAVAHAKAYSKRRDVNHAQGMNKHFQVEERMSHTGSNADYRFTRSHADQKDILLGLLSALQGGGHTSSSDNKDVVAQLFLALSKNKGQSIVISDINEVEVQTVVAKINSLLGNFGETINVYNVNNIKVAKDSDFQSLLTDAKAGKVGAIFFLNVNPVYDFHNQKLLDEALRAVKVTVTTTVSPSETASRTKYVAPTNHALESWSDTVVRGNELSLTQPTIQPLFGTRMWTETLMSVFKVEGDFYGYMKRGWGDFNWNKVLHDGVVKVESLATAQSAGSIDASSAVATLKKYKKGSGLNITTYIKAVGNGDMANNPWLQEMPDPITKATWDNYAMVSPAYAKENDITLGDIVEIKVGDTSISLPAIVQPGTDKNTVAVALGYGRESGGKVAKKLGANAFPFVHFDGSFHYAHNYGTVKKTGKKGVVAQTQTHHSMEGRDIVREATFSEYLNNNKAGHPKPKVKMVNIYPEHNKDGHQWAMSVNLSQCTGCSACIVSCNAENNIPVVGKQEVANRREMHWMRIDRYYKGDENQPEVMHQPMLCQHCENAPCENVCPVLATVHSSDGLNQQVYNRCVGTRYCANNCPYKVRRFNWFNYDRSDKIQKMALNPDVGVRTRGIMEKCSMCIQRIQEGKLTAKRERRALKDGDIKTACQQSCPSDAIVFGDMNDENSKISKYLGDERNYTVLTELNIRPRVSYLTKIRNK